MKTISVLLFFVVLGFIFPSWIGAENAFSNQTWNFDVQIGNLFPGTISIDTPGIDADTDSGFMFGFGADAYVGPKMSMGFKFLHCSVSASDYDYDAGVNAMLINLKGRFNIGEKTQLRPGFVMGYQSISSESDYLDDSAGLNVAFVAQVAYSISMGKALFGEISFLSQPAGGNDVGDITFAPIMFLNIGYEFGN